MNKILQKERDYLINVDPYNFIDNLDCGYLFYELISFDLYADNQFNSISIIGIYTIICNLVSIFSFELLAVKHKESFTNLIKKPFIINKEVVIEIKVETFNFTGENTKYEFEFKFNGGYVLIKDVFETLNIGLYEHRIFIIGINSNEFLGKIILLYNSFINSMLDKID